MLFSYGYPFKALEDNFEGRYGHAKPCTDLGTFLGWFCSSLSGEVVLVHKRIVGLLAGNIERRGERWDITHTCSTEGRKSQPLQNASKLRVSWRPAGERTAYHLKITALYPGYY